jgi:hypothetical protein
LGSFTGSLILYVISMNSLNVGVLLFQALCVSPQPLKSSSASSFTSPLKTLESCAAPAEIREITGCFVCPPVGFEIRLGI